MCKVYNTIGCLTVIKTHLREHNIEEFSSLKEVINFLNKYPSHIQETISEYEARINREKSDLLADLYSINNNIHEQRLKTRNSLSLEIASLENNLIKLKDKASGNSIMRVVHQLKNWYYLNKINSLRKSVDLKVELSTKALEEIKNEKSIRYQFITSNFDTAVKEESSWKIREIERKHKIIEELKNTIYGAIGEQKVVRELEKLSDDYILINDFSLNFQPAIYNRKENDYIKSIQIDHLLIAPSGIFLIETKNWSEKSLMNLDLRSPVQQINRSHFALFRLLTESIRNNMIRLNNHHWGDRRIPVRNIIALMQAKPIGEFQYVKILNISELIRYISYFKPIFNTYEVEEIANYLLHLNAIKYISTR